MEKIVIGHAKNKNIFPLIYNNYEVDLQKYVDSNKTVTIKGYFHPCLYYFQLERARKASFFDTKIIRSSGIVGPVVELSNLGEFTHLITSNFKFVWNKNGFLQYEIYYHRNFIDRTIEYIHGTKIVQYKTIEYIYDLKELIDNDFDSVDYGLNVYSREDLKKIANGDLSLVSSLFPIYFYVNSEGKVNLVKPSLYYSYNYLEKNSDKVMEEAEKLRLDPRNYVPEIFQ